MDNRHTFRNLINRLTGHLRWLLRSRRTRQLDEKAIAIADRYGMRKEYLAARRFGLEPLEALEEWDLLDDYAIKKLNEE